MRERLVSISILVLFAVSIVVALKNPNSSPSSTKAGTSATGKFSFNPGKIGKDGIAVIHLYGVIQTQSQASLFGTYEGGSDGVIKQLKSCLKDKHVKAVVLRINSPGGTVGASQELYDQILKFREAKKPVVVSVADMAASGGYYAACPADKIFANPGSLIGSIGVIMSMPSLEGLFDWAKIDFKGRIIKSGPYKDVGAMYRGISPEERKQLQALVDTTYQQFLDAVLQGRKDADPAVIKESAQGQIFTGQAAKKLGLIDEIGTMQDAIAEAAKLGGLDAKDPYIIPAGQREFLEIIQQFAQANIDAAKASGKPLEQLARGFRSMRLEYMYQPGL